MDGSMASSPRPFYISRDYAALWLGQSISFIGDMVFDTTLILWIAGGIGAGQSWAPAAVGALVFATSLPMLLVGPAAGVFVDRWPKRRTLLRMDAFRAGLILLLPPLTGLLAVPGLAPPSRLWQLGSIYVIVILATACQQFFGPARMVFIRDIVEAPDLSRAFALSQTTQNLAVVLGPAIAALLVSHVGVASALLLNAASFGASFVTILSVRVRERRKEDETEPASDFLGEFVEGVRFFLGHKVLRVLLIALTVAMLGGGALNALDVFFVTDNLHAPAAALGTLNAVYGAGAVAGAVVAAVFSRRLRLALVFSSSVASLGLAFILYARTTVLLPAAVILFLAGLPQAGLTVSLGPLAMHLSPREMLGRVAAIFGPMVSLAMMLSAGAAGLLVSTVLRGFHARVFGFAVGPVDSVFTAAGVLILAAGLYAMISLRGVRSGGEDAPARHDEPASGDHPGVEEVAPAAAYHEPAVFLEE
jgi:MFS family permease